MRKEDEMILVTPTPNVLEVFTEFKDHTGIILGDKKPEQVKLFTETINENIADNLLVKRRGDMEVDNTFKQFIPYTLIQDEQTGKFLVYQRIQNSGETRLHGAMSLGVGGHSNFVVTESIKEELAKIEPTTKDMETVGEIEEFVSNNAQLVQKLTTVTLKEQLAENGKRELSEELEGIEDIQVDILGLLNNETDEVGQVHVCYLQLGKVSDLNTVKVNENEKDVLQIVGWYTMEELGKLSEEHHFETWSDLIIKEFLADK